MKRVALVACSKTKLRKAAPAEELYCSPLFRKSLAAARALGPDVDVRILSAQHGLLALSTVVAPYNTVMAQMGSSERKTWGRLVAIRLANLYPEDVQLTIYAGRLYVDPLINGIKGVAVTCPRLFRWTWDLPLIGMQIGQRLAFLSRQP